jgi:uncharacterized membrane protein YsdA (DUF1294 family)
MKAEPTILFLLGSLAFINVVAFFAMANDKKKSASSGNADRTPEGILFFIASAGGSIGIYLAMILLRHKNRKWYFQVGIPLLILQNVATIYQILQYIA